MTRTPKLKVFRTPIGFHDAYVAAPSQKAALEAWGSDRDLFARGVAERVEDPELMRLPLEHPGEVIRRSRGTAAEQIAALPTSRHKPGTPNERSPTAKEIKARDAKRRRATRKVRPKATPRPSRAALEAAEQALVQVEARQDKERTEIQRRRIELDREQARLEKRHATEQAKMERVIERAKRAYEQAVQAWQG